MFSSLKQKLSKFSADLITDRLFAYFIVIWWRLHPYREKFHFFFRNGLWDAMIYE
jgi:hypothetical protein